MTLGRMAAIIGANVLIIGGGYFVTRLGSGLEAGGSSIAGPGTWSNQSSSANEPTVDATTQVLFDERAGNLAGYNGGNDQPMVLASNASSTNRPGRFAPRRPSDSASSSGSSNDSQDGILRPVTSGSPSVLFPDRGDSSGGLSSTIEYKVRTGDSLWGISKRFNVTVPAIAAANPGLTVNTIREGQVIKVPRTAASSAAASQAASQPPVGLKTVSGTEYTVKSGDSLSRIALRQGVTVAALREANGLSGDMIRIGQKLIIPTGGKKPGDLAAKQHRGPQVTVEAGDTLDKFAAIYGVSIGELMRLNDISNPRLIRIGQVILIPDTSSQPPPAQPRNEFADTLPEPAPAPAAPVETLPTLDSLDTGSSSPRPTLDSLLDELDEEPLDQPLIPIEE